MFDSIYHSDFYPVKIAKLFPFDKYAKNPDLIYNSVFRRTRLEDPSVNLKRFEYQYSLFQSWKEWLKAGRQIFKFSPKLLSMLKDTEVDDVSLDILHFPYKSLYIDLRDLNVFFPETQEEAKIEGVIITKEVNNNKDLDDPSSLFDFTISLTFTGFPFELFDKYKDFFSETGFSLNSFVLYFNKTDSSVTVSQAIAKDHEMFELLELYKYDSTTRKWFKPDIYTETEVSAIKFRQELIDRAMWRFRAG